MAYQVKNHKIEIYDENKCIYVPYCEEFCVEEVITDFMTGKKRVRVKIYADPEPETVELSRGKINRRIVPELIDYGLTFPDTNDDATFAIEILFDSLSNATHRSEHSRLGFVTRKDEKYFLLYKPIRESDGKILDSQYLENEKMKPKGTLSSWKEFINEEVLGHPTLELALGLSAVAPIAHMLREDKYLSLIPMFALIGESSTSKTTTLKLIAATWGNPDENSGIVSDLSCTQNAFFQQLASNSGIPAIFDECSVIPEGWQLNSALYMIPKGKSKLRCDQTGSLRKISRYSGAVIFSGEQDLLQMGMSGKNKGLAARLIQLSFLWTEDEFHSSRVEFGCKNNYGTAAYPLMKWLFEHRCDLPKAYGDQYAKLKEKVATKNGIEDRILKMYALILVAAKAVRCALKLPINISGIRDLLLQTYAENDKVNPDPQKVYEALMRFVLDNNSRFPEEDDASRAYVIWGIRSTRNYRKCVWIDADKFDNFLKDYGIIDIKEIKVQLREKSMIAYDKSQRRYKFNQTLNGIKTLCYCVYTDTRKSPPKSSLTHKNINRSTCKSTVISDKRKMHDLLKDEDNLD